MIAKLTTMLALLLALPSVAFADTCGWLKACEPWRVQITTALEREGISTRYYYLLVAESHCTQRAKSVKGAIGFWQMMPATMRAYGCDNADDIECQTKAASAYIKHLERRFNSFDDVIAAWNMGGHNYKRYGATKEAKGLVYTVSKLEKDYVYCSRL